ncbi:MAG: radical SAM family heme chaperone HemW [Lachnospiraceae bacterium]|nr:radical SAM family heme chaperone HemW [Lachnospiraceae bacterium]
MKGQELELYVHIPFCIQKCKYCDFLSAPAKRQVQNAYMEALLTEIAGKAAGCGIPDVRGELPEEGQAPVRERPVCSVFIGGGTPSAVEPAWIGRVMEALRAHFALRADAEISMEVNPGTVTRKSLRLYREFGIRRLSIGCQSADEKELRTLGRIHTFDQFLDTYRWAREAGFDNINVDLMSALPGQTIERACRSVEAMLQLDPPPEHLSVYSLIVEEGTAFCEQVQAGILTLPDEDTEREIYWRIADFLETNGYEHYEISNYAKAGCRCIHNCGYWTGREYLGFGLGAASLYGHTRFSNTDTLDTYLADPVHSAVQQETLRVQDQMAETMFLGLRMADGVSSGQFLARYGVEPTVPYRTQIASCMRDGLLRVTDAADGGTRLVLTRRGLDVSNYVFAKFL